MGTTAAEQYMLELVNRMRLDPRGEVDRLSNDLGFSISGTLSAGGGGSSALPSYSLDPLAGNFQLGRAADKHVDWMLELDRFSHTGIDGSNAGNRMENEGYDSNKWAENIAFFSLSNYASSNTRNNVEVLHLNLFESDGHRANLLDPSMREVGIGFESGDFHGMDANFAVQNFGLAGGDRFLTGVAYNDKDGDDFYSIGEGKGGVSFSFGSDTKESERAGGYSLSMGRDGHNPNVTIVSGHTKMHVRIDDKAGNVKLDLINGHTLASSSSLTLGVGAENATLLGINKLSLTGNDAQNILTGNDVANLLKGNGGEDKLIGGGGYDKLFGGAGNDKLLGNEGQDYLHGGRGSDSISGGFGNDRLDGGGGYDKLSGGEGNDKLFGNKGHDNLNGGNGSDNIFGGEGNDNLLGGEGNDRLFGNKGLDSLIGGGGSDKLFGSDGDDMLNGGGGSDRLFGGEGNDELFGNEGLDYLHGGRGSDNLLGGEGNDKLFGMKGLDSMSGGGGSDRLYGGEGNDALFGDEDLDYLNGGAGSDELSGGEGNDMLFGMKGLDSLDGGSGDDRLFGGYGEDTLDGGTGNDTLSGGSHADTFVFRLDGGDDNITDFETNVDILALEQTLWTGELTGQEVIDTYATVTADGVLFTFETGTLLLSDVSDLGSLSDHISFI